MTRSARTGKRTARASAALVTLAVWPAMAQIVPTGSAAADILLSQAITEQRVFHTCSAFDRGLHARIVGQWAEQAEQAARILASNDAPPEAIAAFAAAAASGALMPAPGTPFEDVRQFCDTHPDWQDRWANADIILLPDDLPGAFE